MLIPCPFAFELILDLKVLIRCWLLFSSCCECTSSAKDSLQHIVNFVLAVVLELHEISSSKCSFTSIYHFVAELVPFEHGGRLGVPGLS